MHPDHPKPRPATTVPGPDPTLEQRICELETRLTHLSRFVDELNEVVTEQSTRLERLEREHAAQRGHQAGGGFSGLGGAGLGGSGPGGGTAGTAGEDPA
ncbi:MAG: SlyX family protein [Candidatus Riflebacteria bacterium]|nr:SlyX family protein [Candidatus Riflebacteria bacterium]